MGSKQSSEIKTRIGAAGTDEQQARALMLQSAQDASSQLGDLGGLANGKLQLSSQDMALIRQIQELSGEAARGQMRENADMISSSLEDQLLARGMGGASVEAVNAAMGGRQLQQSLDQSALQGQITSAQQLRQQVFDSAGLKLNANQLLLNQLLGGAGGVANMGLQERLAQTTTKSTQKTGAMQNAMSLGGQLAESAAAMYGGGGGVPPTPVGTPGMQGPSVQGPPIG